MADDLEAFLRQAAQRRAARKKPASRPAPPPPAAPPAAARPGFSAVPADDLEEIVEIVDAEVLPEQLGRLETTLDTSRVSERAEHLGEEVGMADEQLAKRLHKKFDHRLGALDDAAGMPAQQPRVRSVANASPNEFAQLLAQPGSLRNAIILSEILTPPQHRW